MNWPLALFEGVALVAAIMILFSKSVLNASLNLLVVMVCIAVMFGLMGSEFLFAAQILIYGGGIVVLIMFATMVSQRGKPMPTELSRLSIPLIFAAAGVIVIAATYANWAQPTGVAMVVPTHQLGLSLLTDYALPLEISGILLLVSLIGAAIISTQKPTQA